MRWDVHTVLVFVNRSWAWIEFKEDLIIHLYRDRSHYALLNILKTSNSISHRINKVSFPLRSRLIVNLLFGAFQFVADTAGLQLSMKVLYAVLKGDIRQFLDQNF